LFTLSSTVVMSDLTSAFSHGGTVQIRSKNVLICKCLLIPQKHFNYICYETPVYSHIQLCKIQNSFNTIFKGTTS